MSQFRTTASIPPVVKNLLIANCMVYLAQFVFEQQGIFLEEWGALWPWQSPAFKVWQLITHMFMHGSFFHLFFNMIVLFMFGKALENFWGSKRFFQFYVICGLVAGFTHLLFSSGEGPALGASGAIMGVMAAFAYLNPDMPLYLWLIPIPIKAKYAIPGLMALDIFGVVFQMSSDHIAHWAHLGGAICGLALVFYWNKYRR